MNMQRTAQAANDAEVQRLAAKMRGTDWKAAGQEKMAAEIAKYRKQKGSK